MKTFTTIVLGLLLIPSVSFAAPLTNDQANSLIAVVQSSPKTPANAFVPLITNFSNITVTQATTLIEVVQAAPGVAATAFVNMLIAFTIDPIVQVSEPVVGAVTTPVNNQQTQVAPVVELTVMKEIQVIKGEARPNAVGDIFYPIDVYYMEDEKEVLGALITISAPSGDFNNNGKRITLSATQKTHHGVGTQGRIGANFQYMPETEGNRTITVSVNGETKTFEGEGNDK